MMKGFHIKAYQFYKKEYAGIILFHVGKNYETYLDDALCLWEILLPGTEHQDRNSMYRFPENKLMDVLQKLQDTGLSVHIIEYRNANGEFAIPKVKQILDDMEADY